MSGYPTRYHNRPIFPDVVASRKLIVTIGGYCCNNVPAVALQPPDLIASPTPFSHDAPAGAPGRLMSFSVSA